MCSCQQSSALPSKGQGHHPNSALHFLTVILVLIRDCLPSRMDIEYEQMEGSSVWDVFCLKTKVLGKKKPTLDIYSIDDCTRVAYTEEKLQTILDLFTEDYQMLGLPHNLKKTKMLYQSSPGHECEPLPQMTLKGKTLKVTKHFPYVGSHLSQGVNTDEEHRH